MMLSPLERERAAGALRKARAELSSALILLRNVTTKVQNAGGDAELVAEMEMTHHTISAQIGPIDRYTRTIETARPASTEVP